MIKTIASVVDYICRHQLGYHLELSRFQFAIGPCQLILPEGNSRNLSDINLESKMISTYRHGLLLLGWSQYAHRGRNFPFSIVLSGEDLFCISCCPEGKAHRFCGRGRSFAVNRRITRSLIPRKVGKTVRDGRTDGDDDDDVPITAQLQVNREDALLVFGGLGFAGTCALAAVAGEESCTDEPATVRNMQII